MSNRKDYTGKQFGNRLIVRNYCTDEDWIKINKPIPNEKTKYRLSKCLNCGRLIPMTIRSEEDSYNRCCFCSNIGNRYNLESDTNEWVLNDNNAVCKIVYKDKIYDCFIDLEDYEKLNKHIWRLSQKRNKFYVVTGSFKNGTEIYIHQMIYGNVDNNLEIDHIDGNSLNNRKNNLRAVTHLTNVDNIKKVRTDNKIGIRGISYDKQRNNYNVDFSYHNIRIYVKPWKTLDEAIYCRLCLENIFGFELIINNENAKNYYLNSFQKEQIENYVKEKVRLLFSNQYAEKIS